MAGPLSGLGQQIPLATTFQPGGAANNAQQQVRPANEQANPAPGEVRAQGAPTNQAQEGSNRNAGQRESFRLSESRVNDNSDGDQRRGSLVDIQV